MPRASNPLPSSWYFFIIHFWFRSHEAQPKEKRRRTELHDSSVKPLKRPFPIPEGAVEAVNTAEASDVSVRHILLQ